jgi:hypothetical protein
MTATALRWSQPGDAEAILADLRPADAAEMRALGSEPEPALRESLRISSWSATGLVDDAPVCLFGVAPTVALQGIGAPWMFATEGLARVRRPFIEACRPVVDVMLQDYPRLQNLVHAQNLGALRWLRWLGFEISKGTLTHNGHAFHLFRAGDWHV